MGFLKPDLPVVEMAEWSKGTRSEKIRPMARHWAEVGFGTPVALHLFVTGQVAEPRGADVICGIVVA